MNGVILSQNQWASVNIDAIDYLTAEHPNEGEYRLVAVMNNGGRVMLGSFINEEGVKKTMCYLSFVMVTNERKTIVIPPANDLSAPTVSIDPRFKDFLDKHYGGNKE